MTKLTEKMKNKIANKLKPVVMKVSEELYHQLDVVVNDMNVDLKDVFNSTEDYDGFWALIAKYFNDYVDTEEYDNI